MAAERRRQATRAVKLLAHPERRLRTREGRVALTFDDGPSEPASSEILDILHFYGIHATFFLVGARMAALPGLVRRMLEQDHAVGTHSFLHPDPWELGLIALRTDYRRGVEQLSRIAGDCTPLLFRPPKGFLDLRGALLARTLGVRTWLWTIDTGDWRPGVEAAEIVAAASAATSGDVILLHDGMEKPIDSCALDRSATIAALPELIENLLARGLSFCRVTD